jgi:hypothetical protein
MAVSDRITVVTDVVCAAIRAYRKREGVTREEFAAAAWERGAPESFTATVVGHLETGRRSAGGRRREITLDELVFVAAVIGVTPLALLGEHAADYGGDQAPQCPRCAGRAGVIEAAVRSDLAEFGDLDGLTMEPSLAATACTLAARIDEGGGEGGKQLPQLAKELRATIEQLLGGRRAPGDGSEDDDEFDDLDAPE